MSISNFFKRRLIRLQPMVIMGMLIGTVCFYFQDSGLWPTIHQVPVYKTLLVMLVGFTLIPLPPSMDIRGWQEMYPLNGPGWSLFFEYIGNILYALFIKKISNTILFIVVCISAVALFHFEIFDKQGDVIGGWSLELKQLHIGFVRLLYPFFAGLLLFRIAKLKNINNAFLWCSLLLIAALVMPRLGGEQNVWLNGIYEAIIIIFIFPAIIYLGASGKIKNKTLNNVPKFLGNISYPIYITHYLLIYIYTGWVNDKKLSLPQVLPVTILVFFSTIAIAYASLKWYYEPVRKWLSKKYL